jgi:hypothetical protein
VDILLVQSHSLYFQLCEALNERKLPSTARKFVISLERAFVGWLQLLAVALTSELSEHLLGMLGQRRGIGRSYTSYMSVYLLYFHLKDGLYQFQVCLKLYEFNRNSGMAGGKFHEDQSVTNEDVRHYR